MFEVGLRSLRGQTRFVAEQLFADGKKQSEVVGMDGNPLGRRTVEREKDNAIQGIADRIEEKKLAINYREIYYKALPENPNLIAIE